MIKLGMIGMSEGNAHPFSWSAIINGVFDAQVIQQVGYPAVADYLKANQDTLGVDNAQVTHIWTQSIEMSAQIALSSQIPFIVEHYEDMIGQVDAVILGRDDPENHVAMSRPFLDSGVPIFIDKPLTISQEQLDWFSKQSEQQKFIMSCSSMRYAGECRTAKTELPSLGSLQLATVVGKKDWKKYGVHMLEALSSIMDDPKPVSVQYIGEEHKDIVLVRYENGVVATVHLMMDICSTFQMTLFGTKGYKLVDIRNSYAMFKDNIVEFVRSVQEGKPRLSFDKTYRIIQVVIGALESKERGNEVVCFDN